MESIDAFQAYLKDIEQQTAIIAESAVSLNKALESEAEAREREDEVKHLISVLAATNEEITRVKRMETDTSYRNIDWDVAWSFAGLAAKLFTADNERARTFVNRFFDNTNKKPPYGTVMVSIGERGIPDGLHVISISELARASKRTERDVMQELRREGNLLFSQEELCRLIDKLVVDIRAGKLHLPLPYEKLAKMIASGYLNPQVTRKEWVSLEPKQR